MYNIIIFSNFLFIYLKKIFSKLLQHSFKFEIQRSRRLSSTHILENDILLAAQEKFTEVDRVEEIFKSGWSRGSPRNVQQYLKISKFFFKRINLKGHQFYLTTQCFTDDVFTQFKVVCVSYFRLLDYILPVFGSVFRTE